MVTVVVKVRITAPTVDWAVMVEKVKDVIAAAPPAPLPTVGRGGMVGSGRRVESARLVVGVEKSGVEMDGRGGDGGDSSPSLLPPPLLPLLSVSNSLQLISLQQVL